MQIKYFLYWDKGKCFFLGHIKANKVYPHQTAPRELSEGYTLFTKKKREKVTL